MTRSYSVEAIWLPEDRAWVSMSDIPGLVIEAGGLTEFMNVLTALVPQMLADNSAVDEARVIFTARRVFDLKAIA